jgi:hypothetical protein
MAVNNLEKALTQSDNIQYDIYLTGLTEETVRKISVEQNEPQWMLEHRLKSLETFHNTPLPKWGPDLSGLNFDEIVYYAKASKTSE